MKRLRCLSAVCSFLLRHRKDDAEDDQSRCEMSPESRVSSLKFFFCVFFSSSVLKLFRELRVQVVGLIPAGSTCGAVKVLWLKASADDRNLCVLQAFPHKHTAVVSSCADHVFVVVGEADVGHMSRVAEVALVFGKLLSAGEVEEFDQSEVVARGDVEAGMRHTCTVDVGFVCVSRPNPQNFISQNTGPGSPGDSVNDCLVAHQLP